MNPASSVPNGREEVRAFVAAFESGTLPKTSWTHHAHLVVGLWYLLHHSREEATDLLRANIRRHNEAVGTANTDNHHHRSVIWAYSARSPWKKIVIFSSAGEIKSSRVLISRNLS